MEATTISSKFQVVIPKKIRRQYNLKPGQKLVFIPYRNSLRVVIAPDIDQAYGFVEGIDTAVPRDEEERV
jgi:AbrB family looped-hinge helix DNA binding protein